MALSRIAKAQQVLFCSRVSFLFNQIFCPICTKINNTIIPSLPLSEDSHITNNLISLFTKHSFSPDSLELKNLAPKLNTKIVEAVLNGMENWKIAHFFFMWASNQRGYEHNCYTYNAMANILSLARQNAALRAMSVDIINSRCSMTPGALGYFLRCLGSVGLIKEANFMFDQVRMMSLCVPNRYSYNCLLEVLAKSGYVDSVDMRLKEMRESGFEFDKYTLTPVLKVYCNAGRFENALHVFNDMFEYGWVDAHVFSILVLSFSKWGEVDKAFQLIQRMEDHKLRLNEKTFHVLIHGFVKESRVDRALQLFDKMREYGLVPDISLFDMLIGGLCKSKELDKIMCLFSQMKELGVHSDVEILSKLLLSFSERDIISLLNERNEHMGDEDLVLLYNSLLISLVNSGSTIKAYHLLQAMMENESYCDVDVDEMIKALKRVPPNATSFSIVVDGLLRIGKLEIALSLFKDMAQFACQPNLLLYNNIIKGLCDSDRLEESYKLLREMTKSGLRPTHFTYNSIFGCLCKREDFVGATELAKEMRVLGHEPWVKHSTFLVKQLCKHGKAVEACNFLYSMVDMDFLPHIVCYSAAMNGLVKIHEVDRALQLFQDICARGYCPDVVAYNILINGLCKANRVSEAQDLVNEMETKGLVPSVVTYNLLIDGWCKNGEIDQAMVCLSTKLGEDREPSVFTYTTLINGFCNLGRPDDAVMLWNEMIKKGCAPNRITYMTLIHGLCKCSKADAALNYLRTMEDKEMEPESFVRVALMNAFLLDINLPMAFETLKEMVEKGNVPDPSCKNYITVRDAIFKLSEDARTCSSVKSLIANGGIPTISLEDIESKGGPLI